MGWDKGRYYSRSTKVNGKVHREYVGSGRVAGLAAELDAIEREKQRIAKDRIEFERRCIKQLDDTVNEIDELADLLARAALLAAGFHQHNRSEWRKQRERKED